MVFETFYDAVSVVLTKRRTDMNDDCSRFKNPVQAFVSETGQNDDRHLSSWSVVLLKFEPGASCIQVQS